MVINQSKNIYKDTKYQNDVSSETLSGSGFRVDNTFKILWIKKYYSEKWDDVKKMYNLAETIKYMSNVKNNVFPLRFDSKKIKNDIKDIAKKKKHSLNQYINLLIEAEIKRYNNNKDNV